MTDTETTSDLLARLGVPTDTRELATILVDALNSAWAVQDEEHPRVAKTLEHEVTAKIHEGLAVYFDQSDGSVQWQDADLAGMFAEEARKHRRIALGLDTENSERTAFWRDRDEIVGYPPYSGGPKS